MNKNSILSLGTGIALFLALDITATLAGKKNSEGSPTDNDISKKTLPMQYKKKNMDDRVESSHSRTTVPLSTESHLFDKKSNTFWVIKSHESFRTSSNELISEQGTWLGTSPCPKIVKYTGSLEADDFSSLKRWLQLKKLKYFGIADKNKSADFDQICSWIPDILKNRKSYEIQEIEKLIWLDLSSTLHQIELGDTADISQEWLENHRAYHQENSHYAEEESSNNRNNEDKKKSLRHIAPATPLEEHSETSCVDDVLSMIISFIYEPEDYVSFMTACKRFHKLAKAYLQQEEKKYLSSPSHFNSPHKQWRLGWAYYYGVLGNENKSKAPLLLKPASDQGQIEAMTQLGYMYLYGYGNQVDKDPGYAIESLLSPAAKKGSVRAQYILGEAYYYGQYDVQRDDKMAIHWHEKAAQQGYLKSMVKLGEIYSNFYSSLKNEDLAAEWFYKAATHTRSSRLWGEAITGLDRITIPKGKFLLGKAYEGKGNYFPALTCYKEAFTQGPLNKMNKKVLTDFQRQVLETLKKGFNLSPDYQCIYGQLLLEKDSYKSEEGLRSLEEASQKGSAEALYILGSLYEEGKGVAKDLNKALELYYEAAFKSYDAKQKIYEIAGMGQDKGNPKAQFLMGNIYQKEQKLEEAVGWFKKAASQGHLEASQALGTAYFKGEGVNQSFTSAKKYLEEPARQGHAEAQYYLGKLYLEGGRGVNKDLEKAKELLQKAAQQNHTEASELIKTLLPKPGV